MLLSIAVVCLGVGGIGLGIRLYRLENIVSKYLDYGRTGTVPNGPAHGLSVLNGPNGGEVIFPNFAREAFDEGKVSSVADILT